MAGGKAKISGKSKSHPTKGKGFGNFVYDSENGTVFGRTAASWLKITIFYIIFYTCLAGFFCLNFYIFSRTLNDESPKWTLDASLIGSNPGIGFRPMPDQDANAESTLIWYRTTNDKDAHFWYKQLTEMIEKTEIPPMTPGVIECSYTGKSATDKEACRVDLSNFGNVCNVDNKFGYKDGTPCILIKLNKIYGWKPEPFGVVDGKFDNETLQEDLKEYVENRELPVALADHINKQVRSNAGNEARILNTVWVSCSGENIGDQENLPVGNINMHPARGIPGYYFPYMNQKNYRSPFIMVHLDIPKSSHHVLINIECRAWAKNIRYERQFRLGSVHFEVMVD